MQKTLEQLVSAAQAGDQAALKNLVQEIQDQIHHLAMRMMVNPDDAQEATQEILILVITKLSTFEGNSAFKTWVYRVAANYLINAKKIRDKELGLTFDIFKQDLESGLDPKTSSSDTLSPNMASGEDRILQEILDEFEYYPDLFLEAIFINALLTQRRQDGGILKTVAMRLSKKAWAMAGREKLRMRLLVSSLMRGEIIDYLAEDPSNLYRILLVQDAFSGVMKNLWGQVKCRGELKLLNSFMDALFILREDNHSVITGHSKKLWGALIKFIAGKLTPAQWFQRLEATYCSGETLYLVLMDIVFQELGTNLNDLAKKLTKEAPPELLAQEENSLVLWFIDDLFIRDKDYEYIDSLAQLVAARVPDTDKAWANLSKEKDILERLLCTAQRNVQQGSDKKGLMCFVENTLRHACAEVLQELLEDDVVNEPFKSMLAKRLESSSGQAEKSQSGLLRSPTLFNINKKSEAHQDSHHTLSLAY